MDQEPSMDKSFLEKVQLAIENNLANENFGVDELAHEIGISRSQLHRRLKSLKLQSASQMIREFRLKKAHEMLQNKVATASEISYQVGFSSPSYFNTSFNEYFGYPPGKVKHIKSPIPAKKYSTARKLLLISIASLVVAATVIISFRETRITDKSIAVLPFENLSGDPDMKWLPDGMMDDITLNLQKIKILSVPDREAVEQYRETDKTATIIGQELKVAHLLYASLKVVENKLNLTVELIRTGKTGSFWSKEYNKTMEDFHSIPGEVAQDVAKVLQAVTTPEEIQHIEKVSTISLTAQQFYQKGRDISLECIREKYFMKMPIDTTKLNMAEKLFLQALEYDSSFAPVYTELAWVVWYSPWKFNSWQTMLDSFVNLADKALTYDDQFSEAYALRGTYYHWSIEGYDEEKALAEYNTALKYNTNNYLALKHKAFLYTYRDLARSIEYLHKATMHDTEVWKTEDILDKLIKRYVWAGFPEKAEFYIRELLKLNRDSSRYYAYLSYMERGNSNWDKAIEYDNKRLALDSTNLDALINLGANYMLIEEYEKSLKFVEKYIDGMNASVGKPDPNWLWIGSAYWRIGNPEMTNHYFDQYLEATIRIIERIIRNPWDYFYRAGIFAFQGMKEEALEDLRVIIDQPSVPSYMLNWMKFHPVFDNIRDDPEFQQILQSAEANYLATYEKIRKWLEENQML